jgi:hypothetical protein
MLLGRLKNKYPLIAVNADVASAGLKAVSIPPPYPGTFCPDM